MSAARPPAAVDLASIGIDHEGDLGEGEERDAQRENDIRREVGARERVQVSEKEPRVLEIGEQAEVRTHR